MIFLSFILLHIQTMLYCRKKLLTSYSGFRILNAEVVMVIPDELTKQG